MSRCAVIRSLRRQAAEKKKISLNHSPYDEKKPAIKPTGEKTESVLVLQQVQPSPGPGDYMKQVGD